MLPLYDSYSQAIPLTLDSDIDECAGDPYPCQIGLCENTIGSYACQCELNDENGCVFCGPGNYIFGGAVCMECPAGTFSTVAYAEGCDSCPENSVANANRTGCVCIEDFSSSGYGDCTLSCGLGEKGVAGTLCVPCPVNTFALTAGVCAPCPPGMGTNGTTGALTVDDCVCLPGYMLNLAETCELACGPGYRADVVNDVCVVSLCCVVHGNWLHPRLLNTFHFMCTHRLSLTSYSLVRSLNSNARSAHTPTRLRQTHSAVTAR